MTSTISVSKGVFVFKNGLKLKKNPKNKTSSSLFDKHFKVEPWYEQYKNAWKEVDAKITALNQKTYNEVLRNLVTYIKECYNSRDAGLYESIVPSATLLTGINQPDHTVQFDALTDQLKSEVTPHIATLQSQDSLTVKSIIENMVYQLITGHDDIFISEDENEIADQKSKKIKKSQCNMTLLKSWYQATYEGKSSKTVFSPTKQKKIVNHKNTLVVIIPDFESFNYNVLQDLILIVGSYTHELPIVLVFGVATSVSALHKSFPYHVSSKLLVQVFQSHSSTSYLNQVLEEVFLAPSCPFHLSGKVFELLTDVFLFYDFSVTGFIQGIKYCMMEHYYADNSKSLCCPRNQISSNVHRLNEEDMERIRRLPSFRAYVESKSCQTRISLLEDDDFLRHQLVKAMNDFHDYLENFHSILKLLYVFVKSLPNCPLGKQIRELYTRCTISPIVNTSDYKQCEQMLNFQSQADLIENIKNGIEILGGTCHKVSRSRRSRSSHFSPLKSSPTKYNIPSRTPTKNANPKKSEDVVLGAVIRELTEFKYRVEYASLDVITTEDDMDLDLENDHSKMNRQLLKEKLLAAAKQDKQEQTELDLVRGQLVAYLRCVFREHLRPPADIPFHELMFLCDASEVRRHIIGAPRQAIHNALNNPQHYLQCTCCLLPAADAVTPSLPDLSIAYKLHRECGKLINLYDWLQAFLTVVSPPDPDLDDAEETRHISPQIQARFTKAVAELQFLGFIKASKRKTDHVMRLTW